MVTLGIRVVLGNNMSQNLNKAIDQAKKSEGYLVVITRLNDKKFTHTYFTQTFPKGDIGKVLNQHKKLLEREMIVESTKSEKTLKVEKKEEKKEFPPEYRK